MIAPFDNNLLLSELPWTLAGGGAGGPLLTTIVTAVVAGVALLLLARRLGLPSIVLLLAGGVLLGPVVGGSSALIQPDSLGSGLGVVISLAVGLILFEGGLTLDRKGYASAPTVIRRLLTLGVAVTWFGTAACLRWICGLDWAHAITTASLVIVTGPTVVGPLLKRIGVSERLASILRWEAVLIDPIGVFIAVLCFEWLVMDHGPGAFLNLGIRVVDGLVFGAIGGLLISAGLRSRRWVPEDLLNVFVLGGALLTFGLAEAIRSEAGLLSVTVAGFIVGLTRSGEVARVHKFKEEMTSLLIALVFMLLAARFDVEQLRDFGWRGALAVLGVIAIVRPLSIALCTQGQPFDLRERTLLAWIAPRGVVAASMASLIAINLERTGAGANARFVETFTWSVIVGTIVLQGLSAGALVRALGLRQARPTGWLIVGAHALSRALARALAPEGSPPVVLVDTNRQHVAEATQQGLRAIVADARDADLFDRPSLAGVGNLLALTDNEDLNLRICAAWAPRLGTHHVFRWAEHDEREHERGQGVPLLWGDEPSAIAFDLTRGARTLVRVPRATELSDGKTLLEVDTQGEALTPSGAIQRLALLPRGALLRQGFDPERVWASEAQDLQTLHAEIHEAFAGTLDPEPGRAAPAVVEQGVAVAHFHAAAATRPTLALVLLPGGVALAPEPEPPVRVVFVLISPRDDSHAHLTALGELARLLADDERRAALVAAERPEELRDLAQEALEQLL